MGEVVQLFTSDEGYLTYSYLHTTQHVSLGNDDLNDDGNVDNHRDQNDQFLKIRSGGEEADEGMGCMRKNELKM